MTKRDDSGAWLERKFQSWLGEVNGLYSLKFADYKVYSRMIAMFPRLALMIQRVPCDRLVVYEGRSYFFELKHVFGERIACSRFKEHQVAHLLKHKRAGGLSYFIIGFSSDMACCEVYALDVDTLVLYLKSGLKSVDKQFCVVTGKKVTNAMDILKYED